MGLVIAGGVPELGEVEAGVNAPKYVDELLAGGGRETLTMLPPEAQAAEKGAETLSRTGQTAEELAKGAEKTVPKARDGVPSGAPPLGPPEFPPQVAPPEPTPGPGGGTPANVWRDPSKPVTAAEAEELAQSVQGQQVRGQSAEVPRQPAPQKLTTPGGGMAFGEAPEIEVGGGQRLQPKATPQVFPEAKPTPQPAKPPPKVAVTPEMAGKTGAAEKGWAEAEAQAAKQRFGPKPDVPMPVSPSAEVQAAKNLARAGAVGAPLIDKEPRKFPAVERPPITEKETPPHVVIDPERREEKAQFPAPQTPEEDRKDLPGEKKPGEEGEILAASPGKKKKKSKLDKEVEEAFKPEKGKIDIRKTPPMAEQSEPRNRKPALSKKQGELLGGYEAKADEKVPKVVAAVLAKQAKTPTPTRKRLGVLRDRFEDLMSKVGDAPALTEAQRERADEILTEARELARGDFDTLADSIWRRLRQDPELLEIEKKLRAAKVVGPGEGALQIKTKPIKGTGTEFESLTLEHGVRLSDDPWLYNSPDNLFVTDASQNEQYLEAIRRGGIWPTSKIEEFVVRHKLSAQKTVYAPGSRLIPQTKP